jgi:hypothetical protein
MIRVVTGCDAEIGQWIGEALGTSLGAGAALGFAENGRLLAGIHYTILSRAWVSCEMSIFADSPRWATRCTLHGVQLSVSTGRQQTLRSNDRNREHARPQISRTPGFS